MGVFTNAFFISGGLFALFKQPIILVYFFAVVGVYAAAHYLIPAGKYNSLRRKIMFSTWERAQEGNIHVKVEMDCTNFIKYQESFEKKEDRPSLTHLVVKAMGQILHVSRTVINGKIVFDRFVPFDTVDVTVLVDINNGEDLAAVTIEKVDEKKITDIRDIIKSKGTRIKKDKGDTDHKQRIQSLQLLPPFIIRVALQLVQWLAFNLGLNIKPLAVKRNTFGGACITSLGMLGIKDAFVPFTPFMNCPVILAVGEIQEKPVVKNGQIVVAPLVNLNFTIDHRYIDGGRSKNLLSALNEVFDNPSKY